MKLSANNIVKKYGARTVVNGVSFDVSQGEIVGLLGPNGAGKTTSFYMVVGLVIPDQGSIQLDDKVITNEPMYKRAQLGVGYLPQEASVFRTLSVEDNIKAVLELTPQSPVEQKDKLESLLEEFGLTHRRKYIGSHLSGGERRRTEIARALAMKPRVIFLDEPAAGLNPKETIEIDRLVRKLADSGITVVLVEHDMKMVMNLSDRILVLDYGKKLTEGTCAEVRKNPDVIAAYLGAHA